MASISRIFAIFPLVLLAIIVTAAGDTLTPAWMPDVEHSRTMLTLPNDGMQRIVTTGGVLHIDVLGSYGAPTDLVLMDEVGNVVARTEAIQGVCMLVIPGGEHWLTVEAEGALVDISVPVMFLPLPRAGGCAAR